MKLYNQRNYPDKKLGYGTTTISSHGCKLTSFSMITEIDPVTLNEKFKKDGCFVRDLLNDIKVGDSIGALFEGILTKDPKKICVAEVDMSPAPDKQQHFVVWMANGTICDPWTGTVRPANTYPVVNYRVFNFDKYLIDMKPTKALAKEYEALLGKDPGDNMNDNEQNDFAKEIKALREKPVENCDQLKEQVKSLEEENAVLKESIRINSPYVELGKKAKDTIDSSNKIILA